MKFSRTSISMVCISIVWVTYSINAFADLNNPYGLVHEEEFQQRYSDEIEPFWDEHGKVGDFLGVDNLKISYMAFDQENEKDAIVISSGRTESYVKYKELIHDLYQQGYAVYIHDHRGQGFSDRILPERHKGHVEDFDDYVTDLDTFVNKVVLTTPHEKLFLLAHSMGGGIATRYIEEYPEVFDAAVLSSPMHAPDARILVSPEGGCLWFRALDWVCRDCYAGFKEKPYEKVDCTDNDFTHSSDRCKQLNVTYMEHEEIQLGGPTRRWAGEACAASAEMLANTGKITIPVLVLQAGDDSAVTPSGQNTFCENLMRETGKECHGGAPLRLDNAKHELLIESDEYRIPALTAILDFFSGVE